MTTPDGVPIVVTRAVRRECFRCRSPYRCHVEVDSAVNKLGGLCGDCLARDQMADLAESSALLAEMRRFFGPDGRSGFDRTS